MFMGNLGIKVYPNNPQSISEIVGLVIEDDFIEMVVIEINRYYDQVNRKYKCAKKSIKWYNTSFCTIILQFISVTSFLFKNNDKA